MVAEKVSLGDGVLRVETAAVVAGALLTALRSRPSRPRPGWLQLLDGEPWIYRSCRTPPRRRNT